MDTNHVTAWEEGNQNLIAKIQILPLTSTLIYASTITLGEIAAGHEMTAGDLQRRHQVKQFLNLYIVPNAIAISHATGSYYGQIIGRIWKRIPPAKSNITTDQHLITNGLHINDVWIVACAWEHGLILLTSDKMTLIRNVTPEVQFENWL